jgi:hypothetical protein
MEEVQERYLKIREVKSGVVVTTVEVLSSKVAVFDDVGDSS